MPLHPVKSHLPGHPNVNNIVKIENCSVSVQNSSDLSAPAKTFTFDSVYDTLATTETLYNDVCYSLVENVLEGYNGTIFAYGQTGCGKTHTMQGPDDDVAHSAQRGVITRSFDHIFEAISVASDVRYLALVSYLEIYNENIRDLLNPHEDVNANHALKEQPGVGVTVPTLSMHTVTDAHECYALLSQGNRNRSVGATLMNASSSRSHSIFSICLEQLHNATNCDEGNGNAVHGGGSEDADVHVISGGIRRGKLNLVDLAGSERQNKTGAVGERLKEATKINLSLSALGNVISALVDGKTKHIPYRDSKLTRLLQDSLGGNTKTLMISCISSADNNYDETLSTLRYASRAKNIANKPKINEDPKDAKLREYQEEILTLKQLLNSSSNSNNVQMPLADFPVVADEMAAQQREWLAAERAKLKVEMEQEVRYLKAANSRQQHEKDERLQEIEQLRHHYEAQLKRLSTANEAAATSSAAAIASSDSGAGERTAASTLQLEARKRIEAIKRALIGGERANDTQLKERRQKKKLDAQRRLSALARVLSRVEQSEDRDLLQGHYTNIQQELNAKNEYLKAYRQKVKALEREVSDLQAEFQLDRADYLESIRRLERNLKFYQQLMDKALPILRKDGKYWDPIEILQSSSWNDDLKVWKLPEIAMNSFKLPPATNGAPTQSKNYFDSNTIKFVKSASSQGSTFIYNNSNNNQSHDNNESDAQAQHYVNEDALMSNGVDNEARTLTDTESYKFDILHNYFRSNRQKTTDALAQQRKGFNYWKEFTQRNKALQRQHVLQANTANGVGGTDNLPSHRTAEHQHQLNLSAAPRTILENRVLSLWLPPQVTSFPQHNLPMNRTWAGYGSDRQRPLTNALQHNKKNALTTQALMKLTLEDVTPMNSGNDTILNMSQQSTMQQQYLQPRPNVPAVMPNHNKPLQALPATVAPLQLQSPRRRPHKVAALAFTQTHMKQQH